MTVQLLSITPALGLKHYSDSALITYAKDRTVDIGLHSASFASLVPTVDEVNEKIIAFETSMQNQRKGEKNTTTAKNKARVALERSLILQATNCAGIADGNLEIYQMSGYGYKSKGHPAGQLPAPQNFRILNGSFSGSIVCKFKGVANNHGYELLVVSQDGTITKAITNSSSPVTINELMPLKRYVVKCRATGARGYMGEWTPEVAISVI